MSTPQELLGASSTRCKKYRLSRRNTSLLTLDERPLLREMIGVEQEQLVYRCSATGCRRFCR